MLRPGEWRVGLTRRSRPSHRGHVMPVAPPLSLGKASLVYLGTGGAEEAVIALSVNVCRQVGSERGCA